MKHMTIGPATVTTDEADLTASYAIGDTTAEGAPPVPYGSGADAFNGCSLDNTRFNFVIYELGLGSLFDHNADGLTRTANEARCVAIEPWMSVRVDAAAARYLAAHPTVMDLNTQDLSRFAYDFCLWLSFWLAWALNTGTEFGPAAFYWSEG